MTSKPRDPRSEAERARAALMRNDAMGTAVPESPIEQQPSVTPRTFGDTSEAGRIRSGAEQGIEAGGARPAGVDGRGAGPEALAESEQATRSRTGTAAADTPERPPSGDDDDALSRAKE